LGRSDGALKGFDCGRVSLEIISLFVSGCIIYFAEQIDRVFYTAFSKTVLPSAITLPAPAK